MYGQKSPPVMSITFCTLRRHISNPEGLAFTVLLLENNVPCARVYVCAPSILKTTLIEFPIVNSECLSPSL